MSKCVSIGYKCGSCSLLRDEKMLMCSGCCAVYYCSQKCQKDDWIAGHKQDCESLKELGDLAKWIKKEINAIVSDAKKNFRGVGYPVIIINNTKKFRDDYELKKPIHFEQPLVCDAILFPFINGDLTDDYYKFVEETKIDHEFFERINLSKILKKLRHVGKKLIIVCAPDINYLHFADI